MVAPPPLPPTGVIATGGPSSIIIGWNASSEAINYKVYRSIISGSGYVQIATTSNLSYTDTSILFIRTYYVVKAVNNMGSSENSSEVNAIAIPVGSVLSIG